MATPQKDEPAFVPYELLGPPAAGELGGRPMSDPRSPRVFAIKLTTLHLPRAPE